MNNSNVRVRKEEDYFILYTVNDQGKENQVPKEQCNHYEYYFVKNTAINYWAHYGIDRTKIPLEHFPSEV